MEEKKMAAKFQKRVLIDAQLMPVVERLRSMGPSLNYQFLSEQPSQDGGAVFRFAHKVSLTSWGENITITLTPYGPAQCVAWVCSECSLPTQIVDWGKNSKNVNEILRFMTSGFGCRDF